MQLPLIGMLLVAAVGAAFYPRRRSPLQLAALTAALLIGFEAVLTHWSYLYLPWFFPFAAFAVLARPVRIASAAIGSVLFLVSWGLLHHGFYARERIIDTPVYERYGEAMTRGAGAVSGLRARVPAGLSAGLRAAGPRRE